jgi:hypothetical protein
MIKNMRWLGRWKTLFRRVFLLLVVLYGILFLKIHKLAITNDHTTTDPDTIVVQVPNFQVKQSKDTENNEPKNLFPPSPPISIEWNTSIVEGQVNHYLQSGKDLWDHSTVLPDWMKRELVLLLSRNYFLSCWKPLLTFIVILFLLCS